MTGLVCLGHGFACGDSADNCTCSYGLNASSPWHQRKPVCITRSISVIRFLCLGAVLKDSWLASELRVHHPDYWKFPDTIGENTQTGCAVYLWSHPCPKIVISMCAHLCRQPPHSTAVHQPPYWHIHKTWAYLWLGQTGTPCDSRTIYVFHACCLGDGRLDEHPQARFAMQQKGC